MSYYFVLRVNTLLILCVQSVKRIYLSTSRRAFDNTKVKMCLFSYLPM